jgi:hypothetical protein
MNDGIPSSPTHLEGLRRLIALLTSAAEMEAVGKRNNNNNTLALWYDFYGDLIMLHFGTT